MQAKQNLRNKRLKLTLSTPLRRTSIANLSSQMDNFLLSAGKLKNGRDQLPKTPCPSASRCFLSIDSSFRKTFPESETLKTFKGTCKKPWKPFRKLELTLFLKPLLVLVLTMRISMDLANFAILAAATSQCSLAMVCLWVKKLRPLGWHSVQNVILTTRWIMGSPNFAVRRAPKPNSLLAIYALPVATSGLQK